MGCARDSPVKGTTAERSLFAVLSTGPKRFSDPATVTMTSTLAGCRVRIQILASRGPRQPIIGPPQWVIPFSAASR